PTWVVPPLGRRVPHPVRALPPPSSLVLAPSPLSLGSLPLRQFASCIGSLQVATSPVARGSFATLAPKICPWKLDPLPPRYTVCCFLHGLIGLPRHSVGRCPSSILRTTSRRAIFEDADRNVSASKFARPPVRSHGYEYRRWAAGASTSKHL